MKDKIPERGPDNLIERGPNVDEGLFMIGVFIVTVAVIIGLFLIVT